MEKKQITNSSTVSRQSRTHNQDQGWEPPLRLGSCHAQPFSPLLPQKGNKRVTFLWPSHHLLAGLPPGPQEGLKSSPQVQDEPRVMGSSGN